MADSALGWLYPAEAEALHAYGLEAATLGPLVEVGSYAGKSACWLGAAAQEAGTVLFAIDTHRGNPEMAPDRECHHPEMIGVDGVHDSLPHFRANMRRAGLEHTVVAIAAPSVVVAAHWAHPVGLVFVDGDHSDEGVMADYDAWAPHVASGGFLAFHDVPVPGVTKAVDRALADGWEQVARVADLAVLTR